MSIQDKELFCYVDIHKKIEISFEYVAIKNGVMKFTLEEETHNSLICDGWQSLFDIENIDLKEYRQMEYIPYANRESLKGLRVQGFIDV